MKRETTIEIMRRRVNESNREGAIETMGRENRDEQILHYHFLQFYSSLISYPMYSEMVRDGEKQSGRLERN